MTDDQFQISLMVKSVWQPEKALAEGTYKIDEYLKSYRQYARPLYSVRDITKGAKLMVVNGYSIRPGYGLHPKLYNKVNGKMVNRKLKKGQPLKAVMINGFDQ